MQPPCDLLCGAVGLHLHHRRGALGGAAARARDREPVLRRRAAQGGTHENGRRTFGHSLVVDPWGEVVADARRRRRRRRRRARAASGSPRCARQLPALEHRRALLMAARDRGGGDRAGARARTARLGRRRRPAARRAARRAAAPATMVDFGSDGRIGAKWNAATRTVAYGRTAEGRPLPRLHRRRRRRQRAARRLRRPGATTATSSRRRGIRAARCWRCWSSRTSTSAARSTRSRATAPTPTTGSSAATAARAWKIYALPEGYDHAITHAAFSPDGSKFVWTERVKAPRFWDLNLFAGAYVFKVADFVAAPRAAPGERAQPPARATSSRAARSNRSPPTTGRSRSTAPIVSKNLFASRIYTMDIESGVDPRADDRELRAGADVHARRQEHRLHDRRRRRHLPVPAARRRLVDHERRRQRQAPPHVHERSRPRRTR